MRMHTPYIGGREEQQSEKQRTGSMSCLMDVRLVAVKLGRESHPILLMLWHGACSSLEAVVVCSHLCLLTRQRRDYGLRRCRTLAYDVATGICSSVCPIEGVSEFDAAARAGGARIEAAQEVKVEALRISFSHEGACGSAVREIVTSLILGASHSC